MPVEEEKRSDRQTAVEPVTLSTKPQEPRPKRHWLVALVVLAAAAILFISGVLPRVRARNNVRKETEQLAIPTVSVVQPKRSAPLQEVVLPANVQPYISSPIFARTNGYLKRW